MNDSFPRNQHRITIDDGWTIEVPGKNGVERRTLVKGAAWSVPIIATAGATPAFAASPQPTLAFTQSSYSGTACGTITGVQVKRTADGTAPDPGKTISVTLADGYTFADGSTTYSGTTDANGLITLPDIKVPAKGGNSNFNASSDSLAASAPVTAPAKNIAGVYGTNGTSPTYANVPSDAKTVGGNYFLAPDGGLYYENGATPVATGVQSASGYLSAGDVHYAAYMTSSGTAGVNKSTGGNTTYANVPAGATPVGGNYFLASNGNLYYENGTSPVATGVQSASGYLSANDTHYVTYMTSAGKANTYSAGTKTSTPYANVPAGATPVGGNYFLASNGNLYYENGTSPVATGVQSASGYLSANDTHYVTYMTSAGKANTYSAGTKTSTPWANVPAGATPVGGNYFLASNGNLYYENGTSPVETGVKSASGYLSSGDVHYAAYVKEATTC
ncbi:hypothetical protein [Rathayibacter toxicus]|uniref:Uncharacterized protein n=1 Tax=Rathayibacter toxicus TaxID=145458 RepID=A0A2S5Y9A8_9MICO|nr:hypothetical protein [Rathayibacter toxicus]PPH25070.1 hypothetical protein C5D17_03665 [Rathayibacter toxicus]PPH58997.1 hypothetical protein C5D30_03680 [Rathayibacter toxicus]PPH60991.1 hypothetical protein C5C93_03715 [Rathayibacter toxicus]PPH88812.1 hypothetical protein C5D31_03685 [Rathayibacter toxicus]PPI16503.1 hypothetical protein C5C51_03675 [Rathayibacter toxicus]